MKKNLPVALLLIFAFHVTADGYQAAKPSAAVNDERLQSMLWVQTSLEFKASCAQVYAGAKASLDRILVARNYTAASEQAGSIFLNKPTAIILDVDETVLDNAPAQARLVATGASFNSEFWNEWCQQASAKPIEGVVDFLNYARGRGVTIFFVTNRDAALDQATARNLTAALGYTVTEDMVLCKNEKPEWTGNKSTRRSEIAKTHRICMLVGDQFGDFIHIEDVSAEKRIEAVSKHMVNMGRFWILLPNPTYGDWEQALYDYDFSLDRDEKKRRKAAALVPWKL